MSNNNLKKIEILEKKYFLELGKILKNNRRSLVNGFNSRLSIRRDTEGISYQENEVAAGAERILMALICRKKLDWQVNSSPISSNLLFELPNAMVNIDAKTYKERAKEENKVNLARNQTSYGQNIHIRSQRTSTRYTWKAALKPIYRHDKRGELFTISFIVKFVYDNNDQSLKEVQLINIPNGKLIDIYGRGYGGGKENIFCRGKSSISSGKPVRDIRFKISAFMNPKLTTGWERKEIIYKKSKN